MILVQELRHAVRRLVRSPGFTIASVITLALGIGATTAVYSLVHSTVIRPLPYPGSDRLVWLDHAGPGIGVEDGLGMTDGLYVHYADRVTTVEEMAIWTREEVTLGTEEPERLDAVAVTPSFFRTIGIAPTLGRPFAEARAGEGAAAVVLSHRLWTRRFGAEPDAIGRSVRLNGVPVEVVGVMPAGFAFPDPDIDLWTPFLVSPSTDFGGFSREGIARLAPGATRAELEAELRGAIPALAERFGAERMLEETRLEPALVPLKAHVVRDAEQTLWILLGSVVFVLLLASANVANLLLVRAESRGREAVVRRALGAGRADILRYFLSEGFLLSLAGAAVGLLLALGAVEVLVRLGPEGLPRLSEVGVSAPVLLVALGILLVTTLAFAVVPMVRRRGSLAAMIKTSGRGTDGGGRSKARSALVAAQVALAFTLLIATGLMSRSFAHLVALDPGFETTGRLTFRVGLDQASYPDRRRAAAFHYETLDRLAALPGVEAAGATTCLPLCGNWAGNQLVVEGRPDDPDEVARVVAIRRVDQGYFEAVGTEAVAGELPTRFDHDGEAGAAVISRELQEAYWPGEDPIGRRFRAATGSDDWFTVAAVVENTPIRGLADDPPPMAYLPLVYRETREASPHALSYVLRTSGRPQGLLGPAREVLRAMDPTVPIAEVATLEQIVARSNASTAFTTAVLGVAAAIALLLGLVGIYGVISYAVGRRTREIGIRMALGARAAQVSRAILAEGGAVVLGGLALGLVAALALTRLMEGLLFGVSPTDPLTFGAVAAVLLAVALAATWLPARRAARVDPARTLRAE